MNTDDLRLILAALGVILVVGIYLFDRLRRKRSDDRDLKDPQSRKRSAVVPAFGVGTYESDEELELPSLHAEPFDAAIPDPAAANTEVEIETSSAPRAADQESDPFGIVQIKVTAHDGMCFSGPMLFDALSMAGLDYGSMKIFHKQPDKHQMPLFSVVNMVEPGTFPIDDAVHFESPGVVFFLQIGVSEKPLAAFDEMLRTAHLLAARIGGEIRDAENELLTVEKTEAIRESLAPVAG